MNPTGLSNADISAIVEEIRYVFSSPNESDSNWEPANVVDGLYRIGRAIDRLADAIRGDREDNGRRG